MRTPPSLLIALTVSAGLHVLLLALGAWLPLLYDRAPQHTRPDRLAAYLRPPADVAAPPLPPAIPDDQPAEATNLAPAAATTAPQEAAPGAPGLPAAQANRTGQTQAPRFVEPPQFRTLETYPLATRLRLSVRLYVSRIGRVERVDVLESGPLPNDMLNAIIAELYNARLSPAHNGGETVAATLDLVIGAEEIPLPGGATASPERRGAVADGVSRQEPPAVGN